MLHHDKYPLTKKRIIHSGAINKKSNLYTPVAFASKTEQYICSDCPHPLIYCDGLVNIAYFRHQFSENEARCELTNNPDYSILKNAKNILKYIIENKDIEITKMCNCCDDITVVNISQNDTNAGNTVFDRYMSLQLMRKVVLNYRMQHNDKNIVVDIAILDENDEPFYFFDVINTSKISEDSRPENSFQFKAKSIIELDLLPNLIKLDCIKIISKCNKCEEYVRLNEEKRLLSVVKINYDIAMNGLIYINNKRSYFEELLGCEITFFQLKKFILDDELIQIHCKNIIIDLKQLFFKQEYEKQVVEQNAKLERTEKYRAVIQNAQKTLLYIFKNKSVSIRNECNGTCNTISEFDIPLSTQNKVAFNYKYKYKHITRYYDVAVLNANDDPIALFLYYYNSFNNNLIHDYPNIFYEISAYSIVNVNRHKSHIILKCKLDRKNQCIECKRGSA